VKITGILLFCLLFPLSGPAWALVDCFGHAHGEDVVHHHNGFAGIDHEAKAPHDAPMFHCPEFRFDTVSVGSVASRSNPKLRDYKYTLTSCRDPSTTEPAITVPSRSFQIIRRTLSYPFLIGLSPHLFLSVFRI
jgi:hypothetical protein